MIAEGLVGGRAGERHADPIGGGVGVVNQRIVRQRGGPSEFGEADITIPTAARIGTEIDLQGGCLLADVDVGGIRIDLSCRVADPHPEAAGSGHIFHREGSRVAVGNGAADVSTCPLIPLVGQVTAGGGYA